MGKINADNVQDLKFPEQVVWGMIFNDDDEIFLCINKDGYLVLPWGKIESYDISPIQALVREVQEELNGTNIQSDNVHPYLDFLDTSPSNKNQIIHIQVFIISVSWTIEDIISKEPFIHMNGDRTNKLLHIPTSWEVRHGKFYNIDHILKKWNKRLGSATKKILEDIKNTRESILRVSREFDTFCSRIDKVLTSEQRRESRKYYEQWWVLSFTPEIALEHKQNISLLIDSLPKINSFRCSWWWRLWYLFPCWSKTYFDERCWINDLLTLWMYIGRVSKFPQSLSISNYSDFDGTQLVNSKRFQIV